MVIYKKIYRKVKVVEKKWRERVKEENKKESMKKKERSFGIYLENVKNLEEMIWKIIEEIRGDNDWEEERKWNRNVYGKKMNRKEKKRNLKEKKYRNENE